MMGTLCPRLLLRMLTLFLLILNIGRLKAEQCRVRNYHIVSEG